MSKLELPHQHPIRFAQEILSKDSHKASVSVEFPDIPSLAMMIEAAAQSSAAFSDNASQEGFLVSLKNVKLLQKPTTALLQADIIIEHSLNNMSIFTFLIHQDTTPVAMGSFTIAIQ